MTPSLLKTLQLSLAATGAVALLAHLLRRSADRDLSKLDDAAALESLRRGPEQMLAIAQVGGLGALLTLIQQVRSSPR